MATSRPHTFAEVLRRCRIAAGLTQEQLAERAGLSVRGISDLERGVNRSPRRVTAERLADALSLAPSERAMMLAARDAARTRPDLMRDPLSGAPTATEAPHPSLFGRERELKAIERHLAGEGPPLLMLAGEPGIGKTRILQEAVARAREQGWTALSGGCHRLGGQGPFAPLLDALQSHLRRVPLAQARADLRGCAWLVRLLPELAERGVTPLPTWSLPAEQEQRLVFDAVARFLGNVAGPSGALLVLDDLQWAGQDALDLLASLMRASEGQSLRILAAYRHTEAPTEHPLNALLADLASAGRVTRLRLKPLAMNASRQLLASILSGADGVQPAMETRLLQRAGGIPFFLMSCAQEVRAGLLESGEEDVAEDRLHGIPWDIAHSIRQRMAALPVPARDLLDIAAVAGRDAPARILLRMGAALGYSSRDLLDALAALGAAHLLIEVSADRYRFPHDLIREAVIAALGTARRMTLHESLAVTLESATDFAPPPPEILAYHYAEAGDARRAVVYLERAGHQARAVLAHTEAEGYYRQLVERLEELALPMEAARARVALGALLLNLERVEEGVVALDLAIATLEQGDDLERLAHAAAYLAAAYAHLGASPECMERILSLAERVSVGAPSEGQGMLCRSLASLYYAQSRMPEWLACIDRLTDLARALKDDNLLVDAMDYRVGYLLRQGRFTEALELDKEVVALAERAENYFTLTYAYHSGSLIYQAMGDLVNDREWIRHAQASAERMGRATPMAHTFSRSGKHWFFAGDWERAREDFTRQFALAEQLGEAWLTSYACLDLGQLDLRTGGEAGGLKLLRRAITSAERSHDFQALRQAHLALADYELVHGQPAAARDRLLPLLDTPGERAILVTSFLPLLAWAYLELGDEERSTAILLECIERAADSQMRPTIAEASRVRALGAVRRQEWEVSASALEHAIATSREIRYPYLEAKALYTCGQLHHAHGAKERASAALTQSLAILNRLGERLYAECAECLLLECQP